MPFVGCLHDISMTLAWRWHGAGGALVYVSVALAWRWRSVSMALLVALVGC